MSPVVPLKFARACALFLSFAFGIVGLAVAINAVVKANNVTSSILSNLPLGITVKLNDSNIKAVGTVLAVGCALSAVVSFILLLGTIFSGVRGTTAVPFFTRTLPLQATILALLALWIFACAIPFDVFYANDDIGIDAGLLGIHVANQIVDQVLDVLGLSVRYRDYDFLRLLAVLPWFAMLFAAIAAAVLLAAHRQASRPKSDPQDRLQEKQSDQWNEGASPRSSDQRN
ncbi:hypothetical protein PENSPDRAFT_373682 [Peniophora sp. CONT]|nr:hypothetical protein PENSPDRAFT_373682 [Peniophora sp. CONT]